MYFLTYFNCIIILIIKMLAFECSSKGTISQVGDNLVLSNHLSNLIFKVTSIFLSMFPIRILILFRTRRAFIMIWIILILTRIGSILRWLHLLIILFINEVSHILWSVIVFLIPFIIMTFEIYLLIVIPIVLIFSIPFIGGRWPPRR